MQHTDIHNRTTRDCTQPRKKIISKEPAPVKNTIYTDTTRQDYTQNNLLSQEQLELVTNTLLSDILFDISPATVLSKGRDPCRKKDVHRKCSRSEGGGGKGSERPASRVLDAPRTRRSLTLSDQLCFKNSRGSIWEAGWKQTMLQERTISLLHDLLI